MYAPRITSLSVTMVKVRAVDALAEDVVKTLCGEDVLPLVRKLRGKENVSEFKLAEQLKVDIKKVRNALYRLYEVNLVEFVRKKDKKKGWDIYYWTFRHDQTPFLGRRIKEERLIKLKEKFVQVGGEQFFVCANKCTRMNFDQAVTFEYRCPECGEITMQEDTEKDVFEMVKEIEKLEKELKK